MQLVFNEPELFTLDLGEACIKCQERTRLICNRFHRRRASAAIDRHYMYSAQPQHRLHPCVQSPQLYEFLNPRNQKQPLGITAAAKR